MNFREALSDSNLFAPLRNHTETHIAWDVFRYAILGEKITDAEFEIYKQLTGRTVRPPRSQFNIVLAVVGRRGGKTQHMSEIAVYQSCFNDYSEYLSVGEIGVVMLLACDRSQAKVLMRYIKGIFHSIPMLNDLIIRENTETIELKNNITIEIHTNSFRAVRGRTVVAALLDEAAFYRDETSSNPDYEVFNAVRASQATIPNSLLVIIGSPYRRKGLMFDLYNENYGNNDSDVLVIQADTHTMNPTVPQKFIDKEYARDPVASAAEYGAQFRTDLENFVIKEQLDKVIEKGCPEHGYGTGIVYFGFVDPSGGSKDSYTLAIAHREPNTEITVLDLIVERKSPFSPEAVTNEFCNILKTYRIKYVQGDNYAAEWPKEQYRKRGIEYKKAEKNRSELYLELLPLINSEQIRLLDNKKLTTQILGLERRTSRSGKDSIDHPPASHDDLANAVAGVIQMVKKPRHTVKVVKLLGTAYGGDYFSF